MSYHLGDAKTTNAPLRLQYTVQGDSFYSLGRAYGVSASDIIAMQPGLKGVPVNNKNIQAFVKSLPGWSRALGLRPYKAGTKPTDNPGTVGPDGKPEGFAQFTARTQLMLPDMPRLDGQVPVGTPADKVSVVSSGWVNYQPDEERSMLPVVLVGSGVVLLAFAFFRKKEQRGTPLSRARAQTTAE